MPRIEQVLPVAFPGARPSSLAEVSRDGTATLRGLTPSPSVVTLGSREGMVAAVPGSKSPPLLLNWSVELDGTRHPLPTEGWRVVDCRERPLPCVGRSSRELRAEFTFGEWIVSSDPRGIRVSVGLDRRVSEAALSAVPKGASELSNAPSGAVTWTVDRVPWLLGEMIVSGDEGARAAQIDGDAIVWAADLRGLEFPLLLDPLISSPEWMTAGRGDLRALGYTPVEPIGDLNADGFDDIVVSGSPSELFWGGPDFNLVRRVGGLTLYGGIGSSSSPGGPGTTDFVGTDTFWDVMHYRFEGGSEVSFTRAEDIRGFDFGGIAAGFGDFDGDGDVEVAVLWHQEVDLVGDDYLTRNVVDTYPVVSGVIDFDNRESAMHHPEYRTGAGMWGGIADFNGDGIDDVVLSAPGCSEYDYYKYWSPRGDPEHGVYLGGPGGISRTPWWRWLDVTPSSGCEHPDIQVVGDLDGRGAPEIVVSGATIEVYYGEELAVGGAPDVIPARPALDPEEGPRSQGFRIGDVNGDGYHDLAIAHPGIVDIHFGGPHGLVPVPGLQVDDSIDPRLDRAQEVGDVNGDGFDDFLLSDPLADVAEHPETGGSYDLAGKVELYAGRYVEDVDADGVPDRYDCGPYLHTVFQGATEEPGNPLDEDCDRQIACYVDLDGDGYAGTGSPVLLPTPADCTGPGLFEVAEDCDDADPLVNPGSTELADDDVDQDCDGTVLCTADLDGDGYGGPTPQPLVGDACSTHPDATTDTSDCDDSRADVNPGATEVAGRIVDEDCDGRVLCGTDQDGDGYGGDLVTVLSVDDRCGHPGLFASLLDCDDGDPLISPDAVEVVADGIDQDCDGHLLCHEDGDRDTWGHPVRTRTIDATPGGCARPEVLASDRVGDCDDEVAEVSPDGVEVVDGRDNDCDGVWLCAVDEDDDNWAADLTVTVTATEECGPGAYLSHRDGDCAPLDPRTHPQASEALLDPVDYDCDEAWKCYPDGDGDGYGVDEGVDPSEPETYVSVARASGTCASPSLGASDVVGDCDDSDPLRSPGSPEVVGDEDDEDCDGEALCWLDADQDGYGNMDGLTTPMGRGYSRCPVGVGRSDKASGVATDCDDADPDTSPVDDELFDGHDDDCDGLVDEWGLEHRGVEAGEDLLLWVRYGPAEKVVTVLSGTTLQSPTACDPGRPATCLELADPRFLHQDTLDSQGALTFEIPIPAGAPEGATRYFQAIVIGAGGRQAAVSEVLEASIGDRSMR